MKINRLVVLAVFLSLVAIGITLSRPEATSAGPAFQVQEPPGVRRAFHDETGQLTFIGTSRNTPIVISAPPEGAGAARSSIATAALAVYGPEFGLAQPGRELAFSALHAPEAGRTVRRYRQVHQGVPVLGGEIVVNMTNLGQLLSMSGEVSPQLSLSTQPTVGADEARLTAVAAIAKVHGISASELVASDPELWIFDERLLRPSERPVELVWRMDVRAVGLQPINELVLINAQTGGLSLHFNQIHTANPDLATYTANNTFSLPGTLLCTEAAVSCTNGSDAHADAAHQYARDTFEFYDTHHNRNSIDDNGLQIVSTVHFGVGFANAFWDGSQMVYGDAFGFPLADDVVGHELTHGVTDNTSNLFYYYQSGAINESLSDIWGEWVDQTNGAGDDSAGVRWLLGEDISGFGAIRDMEDPTAFGDPDKITSPNYDTDTGDDADPNFDHGGVHSNSGVGNKAAFLITDGDTFNGKTVSPLGVDKAAAIYYEVQTNLLTSGSDYGDLYNYLFQACQTLVGGSEGITNNDCQEVTDATDAVEMNLQPATNFNPDAGICPVGQSQTTLFFDDLEGGAGNWDFDDVTGTSSWGISSFFAASGTRHLWGDDSNTLSDSYAELDVDVALPGGSQPYLRFDHAFGFENPDWDGGFLEVSTDGGATWSDAGPLFDDGQDYNGSIFAGGGPGSNPNAGREAFIADSHGYVSTRYDLSQHAGDSVRFRWHTSTDIVVSDLGWFVDDVHIYTCILPAPTLVSPPDNALVTDSTPTFEWTAVTGASEYNLLVATDPAFSGGSEVIDETVGGTNHTPTSDLDDGTYYWKVRTGDGAGGWSAWSETRTFTLDATPPQVTNVDSVADTGDGSLGEGEATDAAITQLLVSFDEEVVDGNGADGAENLANYSLVSDPDGATTVISVDAASYNPGSSISTLDINGGVALPDGDYRLTVVGSTSIKDLAGNPLDGDGDGTGGDDFVRNFSVTAVVPCYTLTTDVNPVGGGSVSANVAPNCNDGAGYTSGTVVALTATPDTGFAFDNWSGDASGTANPVNVTMDSDKSVTAKFSQLCYTLTLIANPANGGSVNANPSPDCNGGTQYTLNSVVLLTASPNSGFAFGSWSGDAGGTANPVNIFIDADKSVTANFSDACYTLNVTASPQNGGIVSVDTAPNCNEGTQYTAGTVVKLTATPQGGFTFDRWTGDAIGRANPINVTMDRNRNVVANFEGECCDESTPYDDRGGSDVELPDKSTPSTPGGAPDDGLPDKATPEEPSSW